MNTVPLLPKPWAELGPREKEAVIEPRWKAGETTRFIATELAVPRNSVIRIITRLRNRAGIAAMPRSVAATYGRPKVVHAPGVASNVRARLVPAGNRPPVVTAANAFDPIPGMTPVEFGSAGCKWPCDGIDGKGLLWCGQPRDTSLREWEPYCRAHRRIAYQPPHVRSAA